MGVLNKKYRLFTRQLSLRLAVKEEVMKLLNGFLYCLVSLNYIIILVGRVLILLEGKCDTAGTGSYIVHFYVRDCFLDAKSVAYTGYFVFPALILSPITIARLVFKNSKY